MKAFWILDWLKGKCTYSHTPSNTIIYRHHLFLFKILWKQCYILALPGVPKAFLLSLLKKCTLAEEMAGCCKSWFTQKNVGPWSILCFDSVQTILQLTNRLSWVWSCVTSTGSMMLERVEEKRLVLCSLSDDYFYMCECFGCCSRLTVIKRAGRQQSTQSTRWLFGRFGKFLKLDAQISMTCQSNSFLFLVLSASLGNSKVMNPEKRFLRMILPYLG